jgi:ABC-type amino acid transport substrate-binding protein
VEGIVFSLPIFVAGTRFLVQSANAATLNPNTPLNNVRLGVLPDTTTEQFVRSNYPRANIVSFEGPEGRANAVTALSEGRIAAFVTDGILAAGEVLQQNRDLSSYVFLPELPLSCEFYGLILPAGDSAWRDTVNQFLTGDPGEAVFNQWFDTIAYEQLNQFDYCLNR